MHARLAASLGGLALMLGAGACDKQNLGIPPPDDQLFFPNGLLLDPRPRPDPADPTKTQKAKYLWAVNGNNDLGYNAGSMMGIDLVAFWDAWFDEAADGGAGATDPWCTEGQRCVQPEGTPTSASFPCRRIAELPRVVECDERYFIADDDEGNPAVARVGDFPTLLAASNVSDMGARLWMPVRGDPSLTYVDVRGPWNEITALECGQGGDDADAKRCAGEHVLTHERNDDALPQLDREPFNLLVSEPTEQNPLRDRLLFVTHAGTENLTVVALGGLLFDETERPAILDQASTFLFDVPGGFGLAQYPCNVATGAVPALTEGCTRPLVFAGWRYLLRAARLTASGIDGGDACVSDLDELGQQGKLVCDPIVRASSSFPVTGLDPLSTVFRPVLGDLAFFPDDPDALWALQTNPGALIRIDTTLDDRGEPSTFPSLPPIEVCDEPTRMVLWQDGIDRYAIISCFRAAQVFVVDLMAHRALDTVRIGTGPHDLAVDPEREAVYVANTLEGSISVVDLSSRRSTRFQELARIGLRDPFKR